MGSGSSRSSRALRRLRGPDSRPAGPGGAAPEGGTGPAAGAREEVPEPSPAAPSDGRDETLRLLDQLLAESAAWAPGEPAPRRPTRPPRAANAGSRVSVARAPGLRGAPNIPRRWRILGLGPLRPRVCTVTSSGCVNRPRFGGTVLGAALRAGPAPPAEVRPPGFLVATTRPSVPAAVSAR